MTTPTTPTTPGGTGTHTVTEGKPISFEIPDHPGRTESRGFAAAKRLAAKIMATIPGGVYGTDHVQMHHGGSLWVFDGVSWRLFLNTLGMEWSSQFCADPAKVDLLRENARVLYQAFPQTVPEMARLGYHDAQAILDSPITDADGIATWVDSIFNSCVPLPARWHTGVRPGGAGEHHFPRPVTNIEFFKRDDFRLWHDDPETGTPVAVVPTGPPGSEAGTVQVVYARPGTPLYDEMAHAHAHGRVHELGADHPITQRALSVGTP